ncbi:chemotaxis protein CheW [Deltaproteobacteria bacterium TL4]
MKTNKTIDVQDRRQYCTFWLADRLFGVDILDVKEINPEVSITPIFHAPPEVEGYVNIRGQIHLVLNLRFLMGFSKKDLDKSSRIVLLKSRVGESFGVLIDRISDVREVDESKIEDRRNTDRGVSATNDSDKRKHELATGVYQLQKELLVVLNAKNFLGAVKT